MDRAKALTFVGLFLTALSTLAFELVLTRLFSVTVWYHFAFLAVSLAMFGMTVGALLVDLCPSAFPQENTTKAMSLGALGFSITSIVAFMTHLALPIILAPSFLTSTVGIFAVALTCLVLAVPFVFSGNVVCLALTRYPGQIGKLYAADLCGAALACLFVVYELNRTSAPTTLLFCAAIGAAASACFAYSAYGSRSNNQFRACVATFIVIGLIAASNILSYSYGGAEPFRLVWIKGRPAEKTIFDKWNPFSYVRVIGDPANPSYPRGWGLNPRWIAPPASGQLFLDIDGNAATYITQFNGHAPPVRYLKYDVTNIGQYLKSQGKVLVIGSGGGRDVLSAMVFGQKEITGLEINPNVLEALLDRFGDFSGHLDRYAGVNFVNDEGRSYVTRSNDRFDILQISLIDTWAATASGAFALSENSLYTVEAWQTFLNHLKPDGILTVSRWYDAHSPAEIMRTVSLASAALKANGAEAPRKHLMLVRYLPRYETGLPEDVGLGTLLVSNAPFSEADVQTIKQKCAEMRFDLMLSPTDTQDPRLAQICDSPYGNSINQRFSFRTDPPTDDCPYFMQLAKLSSLLEPATWSNIGRWTNTLQGLVVVAGLAVLLSILLLACIYIPLAIKGPRFKSTKASWAALGFFMCVGFGFMFVEISQIQRLSVFLGHPTYGLSVVLFSMLISSGLGSYVTNNLPETGLTAPTKRLMVIVFSLLVTGLATWPILHSFQAAALPIRIAVSIGLIAPIGFFMGMAVPTGIKLASRTHPELTPWFWAVNGAASVLGSVLAVLLSICSAISVTYYWAIALYAVAAACAWIVDTEVNSGSVLSIGAAGVPRTGEHDS